MPLGAYVEASKGGSLLFLSGILPMVNRKLSITGRLGESLSVEQGREAVRIAAMNALAVAQQHLGDLDRVKKLVQPGQGDIQLDLFYDYQNNLKSYPKWQQWLRDNKPPLLVLWGHYDTSFTVAGGEAYKRDDPRAEVHILDAGHFALDLKPKEIISLTRDFMARQGR
jgi:pimeloyl-ACP methyl ester carboxylesterase